MAIDKASMSTMPTDVVMRIFEILPHATAACLGLTCHGLYACLKKHHPQPILLGSNNGSHSSGFCCDAYFLWWRGRRIYLWQLLESWMGSKYKIRGLFGEEEPFGNFTGTMRFVNPKIYSELDEYLLKQPPYRQCETGKSFFLEQIPGLDRCTSQSKESDQLQISEI
jgi:hypothetical protein